MSYKIDIEVRPTYLYARITGSNTPETIVGYLQEIADICSERNCSLVLIHECLDGPRLAPIELFEAVSEASFSVLGRFDAVAYVDEEMGELMKFGENVAVNRGMPLAAFDNLDDATRWIIAQDADRHGGEIFRAPPKDE